MKTLEGIPSEQYDSVDYIYEYLNTHKIIGNEENVEYSGIFHIHWRGPIDNDKMILQVKSTLATQEVKKIYFWVEDHMRTMLSPGYKKINQFRDLVEVKVFDKEIMYQVTGEKKNTDMIWSYYNRNHADYRYKSDILRWVALNIYGGIWTGADMFLLRDLRDIHINNWSSKWPYYPYAEAELLKLEKGHDAYEQLYLNNPRNPYCYVMFTPKGVVGAYGLNCENLKFTSLPPSFFDIGQSQGEKVKSDVIPFQRGAEFFERTIQDVNMNNFLKGCFAYHWHNMWNLPEFKESFAGKLNQDIDRILEEKYNVKPIKIFTA